MRQTISRLAAIASFVTAMAVAAGSNASGVRTAGDWTAVCNNLGACEIFGFPQHPSKDFVAGYIDITPRPADAPLIEIMAPPHGSAWRGPAWSVRVDGRRVRGIGDASPVRTMTPAPGGEFGADILVAGFKVEDQKVLLAALHAGKALTVRAPHGQAMTLSLSGLGDLTSWAEEQRALGAAAPVITPAPAVDQPRGRGIPPAAVLDAADQSGCAPTDVMGRKLAGDLFVWSFTCSGDAPEAWSRLYLSAQDGGHLRPVQLPAPPGTDQATFKARPHGHTDDPRRLGQSPWVSLCGLAVDWVWTGAFFDVSSATEVLDCKGVVRSPNLYVTSERAAP